MISHLKATMIVVHIPDPRQSLIQPHARTQGDVFIVLHEMPEKLHLMSMLKDWRKRYAEPFELIDFQTDSS